MIYSDILTRLSRPMNINEFSNIQNSMGENYNSFKKKLFIKPSILLFNIIFPWLMIFVSFLLLSQIKSIKFNLLLIPIFAFWMAFWIKAYSLHFHEAAHYNICVNRKANDIIANIFFAPFFGMWIKQYRKHHWEHHLSLGTTEDTEITYHKPINISEIIIALTGIYILITVGKYFFYYLNKSNNLKQLSHTLLFVSSLLIMFFIQGIIILILYNFFSVFVALSWFLGFFIFSTFLEKIRQTCEHRSLLAKKEIDYKKIEHGPVNRIFGNDFFSIYFGAAGFNKHLLHHIDPSISYTSFKEMENFLIDSNLSKQILSNRFSYLKIFKTLYNK